MESLLGIELPSSTAGHGLSDCDDISRCILHQPTEVAVVQR